METAESTIENLNTQLAELECSESLTRARQQHDSIVSGMQQKHEKQILLLKEKIDELNAVSDEKVRYSKTCIVQLIRSFHDFVVNGWCEKYTVGWFWNTFWLKCVVCSGIFPLSRV